MSTFWFPGMYPMTLGVAPGQYRLPSCRMGQIAASAAAWHGHTTAISQATPTLREFGGPGPAPAGTAATRRPRACPVGVKERPDAARPDNRLRRSRGRAVRPRTPRLLLQFRACPRAQPAWAGLQAMMFAPPRDIEQKSGRGRSLPGAAGFRVAAGNLRVMEAIEL